MAPLQTLGQVVQRNLLYAIWNISSYFNKNLFAQYLQDHHNDLVVRHFNTPHQFSWSGTVLPDQISDFNDLDFLFWSSPLNRGLLRQDFDEASALYKTIQSLNAPLGVEIGRAFGGSTLLMALAVGLNGKILSIDIAPQHDKKLNAVLERYKIRELVELIVGDANRIEITRPLDFVFIDGDHSYEGAKRDHDQWARCVKKGGFVIHHDMSSSRPYSTQWLSLAKLRQEILQRQSHELKLVKEVGSLAVFQRISDDIAGLG